MSKRLHLIKTCSRNIREMQKERRWGLNERVIEDKDLSSTDFVPTPCSLSPEQHLTVSGYTWEVSLFHFLRTQCSSNVRDLQSWPKRSKDKWKTGSLCPYSFPLAFLWHTGLAQPLCSPLFDSSSFVSWATAAEPYSVRPFPIIACNSVLWKI